MAEAAVVYPVAITMILLTIITGLGMYRHQEVAYLAREGARWASVHGPKYQTDQNAAAPTATDVMTNAINSKLVAITTSQLTPTLTWNVAATPPTITFKLNYTWVPGAYHTIIGTKTFTSTSTQLITY